MKLLTTLSLIAVTVSIGSSVARAQTTQPAAGTSPPTTRPAAGPGPQVAPSDQVLNQLLRPADAGRARPLQPVTSPPAVDRTSGGGAVAPAAPQVQVLREGTFIVDRTGRLSRGADGQTWEFVFESDGRALQDPPVIILPNLKLMAMEDAIKNNSRDLRFRITGMVTEYGGRNHILLEKVVVVPDATEQF